LQTVSDLIGEIDSQLDNDFKDYDSHANQEYFYDANGNMIEDKNKGITSITYNHLNQPVEVVQSDKRTEYLYTATGSMLKSIIFLEEQQQNETDYSGVYIYEDYNISVINIPGGRIVQGKLSTEFDEYRYDLTDHLGNVRVTFKKGSLGAEVVQEDHYYPFGLRMSGVHYDNATLMNKFLYNGKELQDQTEYYDYGFRQLDPQFGRWHVVDLLAEATMSESPYAYVSNNPINRIDIAGLRGVSYHTDSDGNLVGEWYGERGPGGLGYFDSYNAMMLDEAYGYGNGGYGGYKDNDGGYWLDEIETTTSTTTWIQFGLEGNIVGIDQTEKTWSRRTGVRIWISNGNATTINWVSSNEKSGMHNLLKGSNGKETGIFVLGSHANQKAIFKDGNQWIFTPEDFRKEMEKNKEWEKAMKEQKKIILILIACNAGSKEMLEDGKLWISNDPIAHQISKELYNDNPNLTIYAPNGYVLIESETGNLLGVSNHTGNGGFIKLINGIQIGDIIPYSD